jgi:Icc-related predicted phosphoesterase
MKICAISDTHNRHKNMKQKYFKECDIVIHSGDATGRGESGEIEAFVKWYSKLPCDTKIFTPGNHDFGFEKDPKRYRKLFEDNGIVLLMNESYTINNIKIFGSPWTPHFFDWAFNAARHEKDFYYDSRTGYMKTYPLIKSFWDAIPDDTNILVTHGPPYGILDELTFVDGTPKGEFVGCEELSKAIERVKPNIHIFGHIHCGYGEVHRDGVSYYNASICDEQYAPTNLPHIIEFDEDEA